jgi:hypothetical protein
MEKDIHEAIVAIMKEVGYVQKQTSRELRYTYAGEAALIEAVRPSMVAHDVYMHVEQIVKIYREQYTTKSGTAMVNTLIHAVIRFEHVSGTFIDVQATGEGADAGDKSANKAMTGAYKYAIRQTFCIETGDDPDRSPSEQFERSTKSATTPQNAPKQAQEATQQPEPTETPSDQPKAPKTGLSVSKLKLAENVIYIKEHTKLEIPIIMKYLNSLDKNGTYELDEIVKAMKAEEK